MVILLLHLLVVSLLLLWLPLRLLELLVLSLQVLCLVLNLKRLSVLHHLKLWQH
jgi:hypothetical protein